MNDFEPEERHPFSTAITVTCWIFAVLGAIVGTGITIYIFMYQQEQAEDDTKAALLMPLFLGVAGYLLGMSLAFLFAPSSFLLSPAGKKWLDMVGTKTTGSARVICVIVALLAIGLFTLLIWAALSGNF